MISKKSAKVIKNIFDYIDNEWVTMEGTWSSEKKHSKDFMRGFKKAKQDVERANRHNFTMIRGMLAGLDKERK
jgi:hypothetical protein